MTLGYYDFPACALAFCTGQKDARPYREGGCLYRRRGRKTTALTLVSFSDPAEAYSQLLRYKGEGAKVQSLNYTSPIPEGIRTKRGPTEWMQHDFDAVRNAGGSRGKRVRRQIRLAGDPYEPTREEALRIFAEWQAWAEGRHFMVFKGHYLSWIDLHYRREFPTRLIAFKGGGIFGWEVHEGVAQITIAKHTPEFPVHDLWSGGLNAIEQKTIHCGSTADRLKELLGCTPVPSWSFDLK